MQLEHVLRFKTIQQCVVNSIIIYLTLIQARQSTIAIRILLYIGEQGDTRGEVYHVEVMVPGNKVAPNGHNACLAP